MRKSLQEFKDFAIKGNAMEMAIGIIIGAAFGKIVSSIVNDIVMPLIGLILGGVNFTDLKITLVRAVMNGTEVVKPAVTINYGNFIQVSIDFILIAISIFIFIKLIASSKRKKEQAAVATPPPPAPDVTLLTEIRDLLKNNKEK